MKIILLLLTSFLFFSQSSFAKTTYPLTIEPNQKPWIFEVEWSDGFAAKLLAISPHTQQKIIIEKFGDTNIQEKTHGHLKNLIEAKDYNFDGYNDLRIIAVQGSQVIQYDIWLFDPQNKTFVKNTMLSELNSPEPNPVNKTITMQGIDKESGKLVTKVLDMSPALINSFSKAKTKTNQTLNDFIKKREMCNHWRGEPFDDEERKKEINENIMKFCPGTEKQLKVFMTEYKNHPEILKKLKALQD